MRLSIWRHEPVPSGLLEWSALSLRVDVDRHVVLCRYRQGFLLWGLLLPDGVSVPNRLAIDPAVPWKSAKTPEGIAALSICNFLV